MVELKPQFIVEYLWNDGFVSLVRVLLYNCDVVVVIEPDNIAWSRDQDSGEEGIIRGHFCENKRLELVSLRKFSSYASCSATVCC